MSHISFSELKNWDKCPFYHKLTYIDKLKLFQGNVFTAFGTAMHTVCEQLLMEKCSNPDETFKAAFKEGLTKLPESVECDHNLIKNMVFQAHDLFPLVMPAVRKYFGDEYEVISVEEQLMEPINGFEDYNFKGYVDLVIKTPDGKYHVIDWKSCSWGWDSRKKSDKMILYQLVYYKKYFSQKHGVDPSDVEVHFGLLKRTAKKDRIELFRVSSGEKRTKNAINFLNKAVYNITNKKFTKNKLACHGPFGPCEFYNTEHCT